MQFAEWMAENKLKDPVVAARLGVHRSYVSLLRRRKRPPSAMTIAHIVEITGGAVTFHDWSESLYGDMKQSAGLTPE